ncbi:MAG: WhiB family transcriptional regulator [Acidimicrobiia bacterium]|nr:WhiB family transcriptional regulator [Acidimicrobiia bacterium]MYC57139.1 WhiB family transcriptional regulator [Acidimicrobiia bacterium]MYG93934.1 WhiB family transcriptional regulator [Acidimicrobiia bacterium]MYI29937.1 WhiB family transcriptional regulator [Acidimicrobiia bacterium]
MNIKNLNVKGLRFQINQTGAEWRHLAACRGSDPALFFPVGRTGMAIKQVEAAKVLCDDCLAQADCLEFALSTNQDSGVWGGTSEDERRQMRRVPTSNRHQAKQRRAKLLRP